MFEDEPELTQKEIVHQMYEDISNDVNNDINVEEDKGKLPTYVRNNIIDGFKKNDLCDYCNVLIAIQTFDT